MVPEPEWEPKIDVKFSPFGTDYVRVKTAVKKQESNASSRGSVISDPDKKRREKLGELYQSLKEHLERLRLENEALQKDLEKKKKDRVERLARHEKERDIALGRLEKIETHLQGAGKIVDEQKGALSRMQSFYRENEDKLTTLTARLEDLEKSSGEDVVPDAGALKSELLRMLSDIQDMRDRRKKLLENGSLDG